MFDEVTQYLTVDTQDVGEFLGSTLKDWFSKNKRVNEFLTKKAEKFFQNPNRDKGWFSEGLFSAFVEKGGLRPEQKDIKELSDSALNGVLDKYSDNKHAQTLIREARSQGIKNPKHLSYILATVENETQFSVFKEKKGKANEDKEYRKEDPETGKAYYGRGYCQLTRRGNYEKMQKEIEKSGRFKGIDIVKNPDVLIDNHELAAFVLVKGMKLWLFSWKSLDDYTLANGDFDAKGARAIVNGTDKADYVAGLYENHKQTLVA